MSHQTGEERRSRERLFDELCKRQRYFIGLFAFAVVFLILQIPYLFVVESGSSLQVIATLNVIGSSVFAIGFGSVLWLCKNR